MLCLLLEQIALQVCCFFLCVCGERELNNLNEVQFVYIHKLEM